MRCVPPHSGRRAAQKWIRQIGAALPFPCCRVHDPTHADYATASGLGETEPCVAAPLC